MYSGLVRGTESIIPQRGDPFGGLFLTQLDFFSQGRRPETRRCVQN
jgi:hypothetical protein